LFALPGIGAAIAERKDAAMRFLLGWAGANWLMFEFVPTKLPHYILPAYPPLAFLAALWIFAGKSEETRGARVLRYIAAAQFAVGSMAFGGAIAFAPAKFGDGAPGWLVALGAVAATFGLAGSLFLLLRRHFAALAAAVLSALILFPTLMWGVAPRLTRIWVSPRLEALVAKDRHPGDPPIVTAGYDEPSLIFLLGTRTRIATGSEAADIAAGEGGLAVIEDRQKRSFLTRLVDLGAEAQAVDRLSGLNYSNGHPVEITIYRVQALPRAASRE
jgi:hypothetical protein